MMEETDKKDEYLWSVRTSIISEDDTNQWKNRRANPLTDLQSMPRTAHTGTNPLYDEGRIRIMASMVPDEIIYNIGDYSKRELDACLLFGDVSGFTDLCEKYNKSGKGGPSRLTQVLNSYIGAMVQEILSHSGDVLKFSGDAFIALWKVTDHLSLRDAVHEAIDCSLVIQKTYGTYHTDVDVVVRVKLAVASGHLVFSLVGDEENSHYLMTGQPIVDIKAAEAKSSAGEIVITARVSHHISANEYLMDILPDGLHAKILGVGPNWRNIQRQYDNKDTFSLISANDEDTSLLENNQNTSKVDKKASLNEEEAEIAALVVTDQYALRPAVNHAARMKLIDELRRFIIAPVMRGIDAEEPLEYLTEIRQVAILFINCKISSLVGPLQGIDVSNEVYLTVCNAVKGKYGCVNKISNFDKDLMLLVIFGLRGFKHELESQIALTCATECYEKIARINEIVGVAAAVTTGKTYCGAFGHTLRREYTVISLVVNKAARLMVAYPDRVTCDRETFLHSKLEARNFILQEYKPLKGIVNPGPIYEYKKVERTQAISSSVSYFPLLGREQEMYLFENMLRKAIQCTNEKSAGLINYLNMLVIQGVFRQGKTRLLEELLFITPDSVPINRFGLTKYDSEISYRTIQWIFMNFVGLPSKTTRDSRERKLKIRLRQSNVENELWVLNPVFDVNFKTPDKSKSLNDVSRLKILQKLFTWLCRECFANFWVIAIDDAESIDDESWLMIQILLDLNLVFIVATMGTNKEITVYAVKALKNSRIKIIELKPIDKWYHIGLACQMLDIEGVPPELEKAIQLRSNGNPGWIESFLISLMQSGGLYITEITRLEAYNSGLVIPPLYMIMRLSQEEIKLWVKIMEEREYSIKEDKVATRWKMFIDSCRESYPDLSVAQAFAEKLNKHNLINVCELHPNFSLDDVDPELHIDVIILKTFDSLTSYEQLLLKCSAILGDIFPRDMLLYIMSSTSVRLTALAVMKLFEIQVLSCAKGNFIEGGLNFKDRLLDPNEDLSVKCECKGLVIDETCDDLPKYASCGYLRFRSSEFRETTYNLLTDNQKREFHERAIRYLEKETRRCRACGNGYFTKHMGGTGARLDDGLKSMKSLKRRKSMTSERSSITEVYSTTKLLQKTSFMSFSSIQSGRSRDFNKAKDTASIVSSGSTATDAMSITDQSSHVMSMGSGNLGLRTIRKLKDNYNLVRTFSGTDFSQCQCLLILNTMYSQLIEHCKGAGLVEKIMNATVEYAYVCLDNVNAPQAIKVLEEALQLLEGPMKDQIELEWMVSLKRGKLFTLLGMALMELKDEESHTYLINALKCYGIKFPTTNVGKKILKRRYKLRQCLKVYFFSKRYGKRIDDDVAEYCNNVSECLILLCKFFQDKGMWREAELCALWSLSKAIETETDFEKLCVAYGYAIYIASTLGQHTFSQALEVFSLRTCHWKKGSLELEELRAVSFLYRHIGHSRWLRGEIDKTIHIDYISWRISSASRCIDCLMHLIPTMATLMLAKKHIMEFGTMLQEVMFLSEQDIDISACAPDELKGNSEMNIVHYEYEKTWYFALCYMLHLETGLVAETFTKCGAFVQSQDLDQSMRDVAAKKRLIVVYWVWQVRNENWEIAILYQNLAWNIEIADIGESVSNIITYRYLLEGLIEYMVNKMDKKNLKASGKADALICDLFKHFKKQARNFPVIVPRVLHLKAYYIVAKHNDYKTAMKFINKSRKLATKFGYEVELAWLKHSEQAWSNKLSREDTYFWRNHADDENLLFYHDLETTDKIVPFTLPLPIYI